MSRLTTCLLISFQISIVLTAALIDEDSVLEQSGDYSGDYIDEAESFSKLPQSRVLFDDEISFENDDSSEINLKESEIEDDDTLKQRILFVDPENVSKNFEMTIKEINDIFGKKKKKRGLKNNSKLSQQEKKAARNCRRKKLLYSLKDKKCHEPTSSGPCRNNKWFVAIKGKLQGVCRRNPCTNEDTPILYNQTCSPIYGVCPDRQRLFLNKKGEGFCDCDEGFSYNIADDSCHREYDLGPCNKGEIWQRIEAPKKHGTGHKVFGECKMDKCGEGEREWKDGDCYLVDTGNSFEMCMDSKKGGIILEDGLLTCKMVQDGRSVIMGVGRSCRRGRTWSSYRNRCVRLFSRG